MGVGGALMKKEDVQTTLKTIRIRDIQVDAERCSDLRDDGLSGRE